MGGGAIGLAIALDLRREGLRVAVIDRTQPGREASWAGAGIIPPAHESHAKTPYDLLRAVSYRRFPELAAEIQSRFGHDIGYRVSGAIDIDETTVSPSLRQHVRDLRSAAGVEHRRLSPVELAELEPELTADQADWIAGHCQIRNPRFLAGIETLLRNDGVDIIADDPAIEFSWKGSSRSEVSGIRLATGTLINADHTIIAAGAWSGQLLQQAGGIDLPIYPVQGQILVLDAHDITLRHILLQGKRYIVPRDDGLVLIGSTEEEVGFGKQVTAQAMTDLRQFASSLVPALARKPALHSWAGLRPANRLGHPVLGRAGGITNLWVATGHFRHGVQQSLGTSRLIADWIVGRPSFARPRISPSIGPLKNSSPPSNHEPLAKSDNERRSPGEKFHQPRPIDGMQSKLISTAVAVIVRARRSHPTILDAPFLQKASMARRHPSKPGLQAIQADRRQTPPLIHRHPRRRMRENRHPAGLMNRLDRLLQRNLARRRDATDITQVTIESDPRTGGEPLANQFPRQMLAARAHLISKANKFLVVKTGKLRSNPFHQPVEPISTTMKQSLTQLRQRTRRRVKSIGKQMQRTLSPTR